MAELTIVPVPKTSSLKPGWKTTEFLLSTAAMVVGTLLASGVLAEGGLAARIAGAAMTVLAALGYTYNRTQLKKTNDG